MGKFLPFPIPIQDFDKNLNRHVTVTPLDILLTLNEVTNETRERIKNKAVTTPISLLRNFAKYFRQSRIRGVADLLTEGILLTSYRPFLADDFLQEAPSSAYIDILIINLQYSTITDSSTKNG